LNDNLDNQIKKELNEYLQKSVTFNEIEKGKIKTTILEQEYKRTKKFKHFAIHSLTVVTIIFVMVSISYLLIKENAITYSVQNANLNNYAVMQKEIQHNFLAKNKNEHEIDVNEAKKEYNIESVLNVIRIYNETDQKLEPLLKYKEDFYNYYFVEFTTKEEVYKLFYDIMTVDFAKKWWEDALTVHEQKVYFLSELNSGDIDLTKDYNIVQISPTEYRFKQDAEDTRYFNGHYMNFIYIESKWLINDIGYY
jgi:hypothetical protein